MHFFNDFNVHRVKYTRQGIPMENVVFFLCVHFLECEHQHLQLDSFCVMGKRNFYEHAAISSRHANIFLFHFKTNILTQILYV